MTEQNKGTVLVGMSGGVDSSVAAMLLQQQGYTVIGVTFRLWKSPENMVQENYCGSNRDVEDARRVCDILGIRHLEFDFEELFRREVVDRFVSSYQRGITPNPCIDCNRKVKFAAFLQQADALGVDYIATGHYGKVVQDPLSGRYVLQRGEAHGKDQSYVLYSLNQEQLSRLLLPLWGYEKEQVRQMAKDAGLPVFNKPDSQDICFIPDGDCAGFLRAYTGTIPPEGNFIDLQGNVIGRHRGIWYYTIGQRKGLGVSFGKPMFVAKIDAQSGDITLAEDADLRADSLIAEALNWVAIPALTAPVRAEAKIRYSAKPAPALLTPLGEDRVLVTFDTPQRAVTPGQAVTFYQGESVLGGGTIVQ